VAVNDLKEQLRRVAKDLLPPIVVRHLPRPKPVSVGPTWTGDYRTYDDAVRATGSAGYEDPSVIEKMMRATREHRDRAVALGRVVPDSRTFQNLTAFLVALDGFAPKTLHVLDFGGGAGLHYFALAPLLSRRMQLHWTVCEVPSMARAARDAFGSPALRFVDSMDAVSAERFHIVLASGSLQYAPDPTGLWRQIARSTDVLIVNRTPFIDAAADRLTVQTVPVASGQARYPAWFLSDATWLRRFAEQGFQVDLRWSVPEDGATLDHAPVAFSGLVVRRANRDAIP
jgi:putative methyltransferase (TIGR04325 family)